MNLIRKVSLPIASITLLILALFAFPAVAQTRDGPTAYDAQTIRDTFVAGTKGNAVVFRVANSTGQKVTGVKMAPSFPLQWVDLAGVTPESVTLEPGETVDFRIEFGIRDAAPNGASEEVMLFFQADGGVEIDNPIFRLIVDITKEPEEKAPEPGEIAERYLTLTNIDIPRSGVLKHAWYGDWDWKVEPGIPGMVGTQSKLVDSVLSLPRREKYKIESVMSLGFTDLPEKIIPGQPFTITSEVRLRKSYSPNTRCIIRRSVEKEPSEFSVVSSVTFERIRASSQPSVSSYCVAAPICRPGPNNTKNCRRGKLDDDWTVRITYDFTPDESATRRKSLETHYTWKVSVKADHVLRQPEDGDAGTFYVILKDKLHANGKPNGKYKPFSGRKFHLKWPDGSRDDFPTVSVTYGEVGDDNKAIPVRPHEHPDLFKQPPRRNTETGETAENEAGKDDSNGERTTSAGSGTGATPAGASGGGASGNARGGPRTASLPPGGGKGPPTNPAAVDPNSPDIAGHINTWLGVAEPPDNAKGASARYNPWGQIEGQLVGGQAVANARPDVVPGTTPEQHVWSQRDRLDSIDHCTVGEYVMAKLANRGTDHCRGRYKGQKLVQVASMVGRPGAAAKKTLEAKGLKVRFKMGRPAPSKRKALTVISQDVRNKRVKPGSTVTLTVHDEFKAPVRVPTVKGQPTTLAHSRLTQAGFTVKVVPIGPAPGAAMALTARDTRPAANRTAARGSEVVLNVYGAFDDSAVMPSVIGMDQKDATRLLESMGINTYARRGDKAPGKSQSFKVTAQSIARGTKITPRSTVTLTYYDKFVWSMTMPRLIGLSPQQVANRLKGHQLTLREDRGNRPPSRNLSGKVASQSVRAGQTVEEGHRLTLVYYRESPAGNVAGPRRGGRTSGPRQPQPDGFAPVPPRNTYVDWIPRGDSCRRPTENPQFITVTLEGGRICPTGWKAAGYVHESNVRKWGKCAYCGPGFKSRRNRFGCCVPKAGVSTRTAGRGGTTPGSGRRGNPVSASSNRTFNPDTPRQFNCKVRIPSLPLDPRAGNNKTGRVADYNFEAHRTTRGYSCQHLLGGKVRRVVVHFVTSSKAPASRMREYCQKELSSTYGDRRAINIFMNGHNWPPADNEKKLARAVGPSNARKILQFHASQAIPYAVPCEHAER